MLACRFRLWLWLLAGASFVNLSVYELGEFNHGKLFE